MKVSEVQKTLSQMIVLPMLEGERTECVVNRTYAYVLMRREVEVDWALVNEIRHMVERSMWPQDTFWQVERKEVLSHYEDAFDESLPEERRRTHAEIVFSRMWIYINNLMMPMRFDLDRFVAMNLQAGLT